MLIVGLTGSIGMGKSETGRIFKRRKVPFFDSDAEVRRLSRRGTPTAKRIMTSFPDAARNERIDRRRLAEIIFSDLDQRKRLENILHPLVRKAQRRFVLHWARRDAAAVLVDVPLLFESGLENFFDQIITVTAPATIQRQRVLSRPGMSEERFNQILASQMSDLEKIRRADLVIDTGRGKMPVYTKARSCVRTWRDRRGGALRLWRRRDA